MTIAKTVLSATTERAIRDAYRMGANQSQLARRFGIGVSVVARLVQGIQRGHYGRGNLDWQDDAACAGYSLETFFPEPGDAASIKEAVAICRSCPVVELCAEWATESRSSGGVFGGRFIGERESRRRAA